MGPRNRWLRAAGAIVGVVGVSHSPRRPSRPPASSRCFSAWLLWRGQPDGVALALVWVVVFELCSWTLLTGRRSLTWIVAVAPLMVAGLLLAEWVAGRARGGASRSVRR